MEAGDAWFVRAAHDAATQADAEALRAVADDDRSSRATAPQRRASLALGHNLLRAAARIALPDERGRFGWVVETLGDAAPRATTFGAVSAALGVAGADAAEAHAYSVLAGMVAAAVRLRLVSPLDGQAALRRALAVKPVEPAAGWGFFSPLLDIASMGQERLEPRLFAS